MLIKDEIQERCAIFGRTRWNTLESIYMVGDRAIVYRSLNRRRNLPREETGYKHARSIHEDTWSSSKRDEMQPWLYLTL